MSVEVAAKAFAIYQLKKVLISLVKNEIPRLYNLLSRYTNSKIANQGYI